MIKTTETIICDRCNATIPGKDYGAAIDPKHGGCGDINDGKARHLCKECTGDRWRLSAIRGNVCYLRYCKDEPQAPDQQPGRWVCVDERKPTGDKPPIILNVDREANGKRKVATWQAISANWREWPKSYRYWWDGDGPWRGLPAEFC